MCHDFLNRFPLLRTDGCYTLMGVVLETDAGAMLFQRAWLICVIGQIPHPYFHASTNPLP